MKPAEVTLIVCRTLDVSKSAMVGHDRRKPVVEGRNILAFQLSRRAGLSLDAIAGILSHTVRGVTYMIRNAQEHQSVDPAFNEKFQKVEEALDAK